MHPCTNMVTIILSTNYVYKFYRLTTKKYSSSILHANKKNNAHKIVLAYYNKYKIYAYINRKIFKLVIIVVDDVLIRRLV